MRAALRIEPDVGGAAPRNATAGILDQIIVYGLFGILGFSPLAFGAVQPWAVFTLESAATVLFVLWLIVQVRLGEIRISENSLFAPMVLFAGLVALQILT
ncbi:MAG TPA: hypothetical protein VLK33_03745, partial [Terriglobales bacterium]|nr:hypothetical protein [Terriglobales bacterium]